LLSTHHHFHFIFLAADSFVIDCSVRGIRMASRGRITIEIDKTTKSQLQAVLKDKLSKISSYTDDVLPVRQCIDFLNESKSIKKHLLFYTTYTVHVPWPNNC
jgi:hypothetical protein